MRVLHCILMVLLLCGPVAAQNMDVERSSTGGAQTLEDILARQAGQKIDYSFRSDALGDPSQAKDIAEQLGTLGGVSQSELWRAIRYNASDNSASGNGNVGNVMIQSGGMPWYEFREGPLRQYGGGLLLVTLILLGVFYIIRGRIRIDGGPAGSTITRFKAVERFGHWVLAGSFILLGVTGLLTLFGRVILAPYFGKELNSTLLIASKWIHNNGSWAFMLALIMVFVMWVVHNIPNRTDWIWIKQGGGIFTKSHPPAKKFNFGQKIIFWGVIVLGASVSASGLSLLFPFEMPMFAKTFAIMNNTGLSELLGVGTLATDLSPQEDMQFAQAWHAIVAFVMMAMILAHIYIGTLGMEGAYDAMGSGEVDEEWARQHHSLWYEEVKAKQTNSQPAE